MSKEQVERDLCELSTTGLDVRARKNCMQVLTSVPTAEIIKIPLTFLGNFSVWKRERRVCAMALNVTVIRPVQIKLVVNVSFKPFLSFLFFYYHYHYLEGGRGRVRGRGNKPWQIFHIKLYDVVLTDMNISDLCVCTALPVKHFRSLVHKMCPDKGKLHTDKQSNEYTLTCSPSPLWDGKYQKQNLKFPSGGITYMLGAFPWFDLQNEQQMKGCHFPAGWDSGCTLVAINVLLMKNTLCFHWIAWLYFGILFTTENYLLSNPQWSIASTSF